MDGDQGTEEKRPEEATGAEEGKDGKRDKPKRLSFLEMGRSFMGRRPVDTDDDITERPFTAEEERAGAIIVAQARVYLTGASRLALEQRRSSYFRSLVRSSSSQADN